MLDESPFSPPAARPLLKDIAHNLGVDISTVSKALRNYAAVAPATRARVRAEADRIGYVPDPMLTSLTCYREQLRPGGFRATLAWLYNYPRDTDMSRFTGYVDYVRGARRRAEQLGYRLEEFHVDGWQMRLPRLAGIFAARRIEGVVVAPQAAAGAEMEFPWEGFSLVTIGLTLLKPRLNAVANDHFETMLRLRDELHKRGYARVGLYLDHHHNERIERRFQSALLAYSGGHPDAVHLYERPSAEQFLHWFHRGQFDAVITGTAAVVEWLRQAGHRVPEDAGVAHYALEPEETMLSGMSQNYRLIGAAAIDLVVAQLHRGERGVPATTTRQLVDSSWMEGRTVRPFDAALAPAPLAPVATAGRPS